MPQGLGSRNRLLVDWTEHFLSSGRELVNATPSGGDLSPIAYEGISQQESTIWTPQRCPSLDGVTSGTTVQELFRNSVAMGGARKVTDLAIAPCAE